MIQAPTHINDEEATAASIPVEENINESTDADYSPEVALEIPKAPSHENNDEEDDEEGENQPQSMPNPLSEINEQITTIRTNENVIDGPTPIGTSEIRKLETEVDKTIENANNVIDVVIPPIQQEDKLLEEIVHMISNSPESVTTLPSTTEAPVTVTYHQKHHHHHHHHEVESEELTTILDENAVKTTIDLITIPSSTTTTTIAPEVETIFPPINNNEEQRHHHHLTNAFDEKLPIVIELTTTSSSTVSEIMKLNEKLSSKLENKKKWEHTIAQTNEQCCR